MKTHSAKAKGRRLAKKIKEDLLKEEARLTEDDITVTPSGVPGIDIQLSAFAKTIYPYSIECKNQERLNLWESWEQAIKNTHIATVPLLIIAKNRQEPLVVLKWEDFIAFIRK